MFNLFKTVRLRWFEISIFKVGVLAVGVAIGAYWPDVFGEYINQLVGLAAIALVYIAFVWFRQK